MLDPDLGGQKNIFAIHTGFFDCCAHLLFVEVGLCRVDGAVAHLQSIQYTALAFLLRDLIDPIAKLGHFYAVIQCDIVHIKASLLR